jgi:hypothetical protein
MGAVTFFLPWRNWGNEPCRALGGELNFKTGARETGVATEPLAQQRNDLVLLVARVGWMGDIAGHLHEPKDPLRSIGQTDARRAGGPGRHSLDRR